MIGWKLNSTRFMIKINLYRWKGAAHGSPFLDENVGDLTKV